MSDDTISELVKVRDALYETIDGLRRQLTAAQIRVAELECSLRFSFQAEVRQLREQLAARDAEILTLLSRIQLLEDALDTYAQHTSTCPCAAVSPTATCTCGLAALLGLRRRVEAAAVRDTTHP